MSWELIPSDISITDAQISSNEITDIRAISRLSLEGGEQSAQATLLNSTVNNIVAHPILLPRFLKEGGLGTDMYDRENRKTIALMAECRTNQQTGLCDPIAELPSSTFTIQPKDNLRFRVPAMFNIARADGLPIIDNDFYPENACANINELTELVISPPSLGSFEYQVQQWYKEYLKSILLASAYKDEKTGDVLLRIKHLLLGNETAAGVFIHPQIYAHYMSQVKQLMQEIVLENKLKTTPKMMFGNWSNPHYLRSCLAPYFDIFETEMNKLSSQVQDMPSQKCLFESSSVDLYFNFEDYPEEHDTDVYWYKKRVSEMCPATEFLVKETGFSFDIYSESRHYNPQTQMRECLPYSPCLSDANHPADEQALDSRMVSSATKINDHLRSMGFTNIAWFNHTRFGGEHGDVIVDVKPNEATGKIENTRLGSFIKTLDVPQYPNKADCSVLDFQVYHGKVGELPIVKWSTDCGNNASVQVKTTISSEVLLEGCDLDKALWDGNKSGSRSVSFMLGGYGNACPNVDSAVFWVELRHPKSDELLFRTNFKSATYRH